MYILFEKYDSNCDTENLSDYDLVGYAESEDAADNWVSGNPKYRRYRFCHSIPVGKPISDNDTFSVSNLTICKL